MWVSVSAKREMSALISRAKLCVGCIVGGTRSQIDKSGVRVVAMAKKALKSKREKEERKRI